MNPAKIDMCKECGRGCEEPCLAVEKLFEIYEEERTREKKTLIKALRKQLGLIDCEPSKKMAKLGEAVIEHIKELHYIKDYGVKIGYVISFETKKSNKKIVFADCRKVSAPYTAYLPYDILVTVYEPNASLFSENQQKILMWHELKHIEVGPRGVTVRPHDIEDWESIIKKFGIKWSEFGREVPDILKVKGNGKRKRKKRPTKSNRIRTDTGRKKDS